MRIKRSRRAVVLIIILAACLGFNIGVFSTPNKSAAANSKRNELQKSVKSIILTQEGAVATAGARPETEPVQAPMPKNVTRFYLQAFQDAELTRAIKAEAPGAKWKAGVPFYIKISALRADGTPDMEVYFNTPGKTNVSGAIIAFDPVHGMQYGNTDFPQIRSEQITDVAPGTGKAQAVFYDTGIIQLAYANSLGVPVSSEAIGRFYPDHFNIMSQNGIPVLTMRGDISNNQAVSDGQLTWGYIGEPLSLTATLQACAANGQITENYEGIVEPDAKGWGLSVKGHDGRDYTSRVSITAHSQFKAGKAEFTATLTIAKELALKDQELISGLSVSICPADTDGASLKTPALAGVLGPTGFLPGPYDLYTGVISIPGGYYNQANVIVPVMVYIWNGTKFEVNTLDSQTTVKLNEIPAPDGATFLTILNGSFTVINGKASMSVTFDTKRLTQTKEETVIHFQSAVPYLEATGTIAWGPS